MRRNKIEKIYRVKKRRKKGSTPPEHIKSCKLKQRFPDKLEADLAAIMYNNHRALMFSPVEAYKCFKHNCWHIGHMRRRVGNEQKIING